MEEEKEVADGLSTALDRGPSVCMHGEKSFLIRRHHLLITDECSNSGILENM
ncbi:hypothetical protein MUK42_29085 [Musa troglodytarum]|uniref:Uncharacterized protein n=1 Tax=Musa troglodytarum TaxID=320322 RepID=A0A9E7K0B9_9LILI|nr:hypothetical protein MUK42_29085 [Musa troglodytarum]